MAVEWKGVGELEIAKANGLDMALEALKDDAIVRSPTASGELDRSARSARQGNLGAVGFDTDYAIIQHQRQGLNHDNGGPGFLAAALEALPIEQIIGEQLRRKIGG